MNNPVTSGFESNFSEHCYLHRQESVFSKTSASTKGQPLLKSLIKVLFLLCVIPFTSMGADAPKEKQNLHPGQATFIEEMITELQTTRPDLTYERINSLLSKAIYQPRIIAAITKPAEAKPWYIYRPLFLTDDRIKAGVAFWLAHATLLSEVEKKYGVPAEIIVAIIGIETFYGKNTGNWRALDALTTLAFYYPQRAPYFRQELKQFLQLATQSFPLPIDAVKGSYAGAMGWGQFMPTSYLKWAVDYNQDQKTDLWNSPPDIIASVANYLADHGWQRNELIATKAQVKKNARALEPENLKPTYSIEQLQEWGYSSTSQLDPNTQVNLLRLDAHGGDEFWIIQNNFTVLATYNRSPLYCMAVLQLAEKMTTLYHAP
jgi:membrane-bound lytic murein transglycosylase B